MASSPAVPRGQHGFGARLLTAIGAEVLACCAVALVVWPMAATARWVIVPSPKPRGPTDNSFLDISCTSRSACEAVGGLDPRSPSTAERAFAERWNGRSWSLQRVPIPDGAKHTSLTSVSCSSSRQCLAILGIDDRGRDLLERWDGRRWSIEHPARQPGASQQSLYGVDCPARNACFAVGEWGTAQEAHFALVERWNGATWAIANLPDSFGTENASSLSAVSCTTASACMAVGWASTRSSVEHWNGVTWSFQTDAAWLNDESGGLSAVSCGSASACAATGGLAYGASGNDYVEFWNGSYWGWLTTTSGDLEDVSCFSARVCFAIGTVAFAPGAVAFRWNGHHWTRLETPLHNESLHAVSCPTQTLCMMAGEALGKRADTPLAVLWTAR